MFPCNEKTSVKTSRIPDHCKDIFRLSYLNLREHTLNRKPSDLNMVSQRFILSKENKGMLPWTIIFVWASLAKEVFTQHYKFFLGSFFFLGAKGKNFLERANWCVSGLNHLAIGDARSPRCSIYTATVLTMPS